MLFQKGAVSPSEDSTTGVGLKAFYKLSVFLSGEEESQLTTELLAVHIRCEPGVLTMFFLAGSSPSINTKSTVLKMFHFISNYGRCNSLKRRKLKLLSTSITTHTKHLG